MGESQRRKAAMIQAHLQVMEGLTADKTTIAKTAISLFENFVLPLRYNGGCYLTTMFLHRYLREEAGIITEPTVGYVNDGTDDIMMSHAWLEFDGLKTDITLYILDPVSAAPNGSVLILDRVLHAGEVQHSYHREQTVAGAAKTNEMLADPRLRALVQHKEREHREMLARMTDPDLAATYMAQAPSGLRYADLCTAVNRPAK